jgi:hypothetical protein
VVDLCCVGKDRSRQRSADAAATPHNCGRNITARGLQGSASVERRLDHPDAFCSAPQNGSYVSEIVMWPWPMGAADHTGRHVDRRHITDWPRWGCLHHRWTERRLSWCAIVFVSRPSIHRALSARADRGPPVNPISCAAHRRIPAIENCVSRLFSVARSTTSDDVGSTCRQIESDQSPRYTAAAARVLCYRVRPTIR